ncbi:T9SS type A sorting domain-containing protein [Aridibaculum aurantiacum]|uniref:rhamnogalacturonan lyase family protein n=1 Tax=Aridibaculum aurantiacum TaxID=2810307 RepID=UPI001A95BA9B|nr:T9SS type A sorting domain-containing protein [Aridibaculum aurantiacum]
MKKDLQCNALQRLVLPLQVVSSKAILFRLLLLTTALGVSSLLQAQHWTILGNESQVASATSNHTSIAVLLEGDEGTTTVPYVAFIESGVPKVKKLVAGAWEQVGNNLSTGSASYTRIIADNNNRLYVSYVDGTNSNRLAVKTYDTSSASWQPLNNDPNNLHLSAGSVTYSISQYSSTPRSTFALDTANRLYVIFGEGSGLVPTVKRYNGTAWETVGGAPVSSDRAVGVGIAIDSTTNAPYVVYAQLATATSTTGTVMAYRFINNAWENIPVPSPVLPGSSTTGSTTGVRHTVITFNYQWNPVVSYFNANNSNRSTIIIYNKSTSSWSYEGTVSARDISNNSLVRDFAGNLYNTFTDAYSNGSGRSVARVMRQRAGTTNWVELKDPNVTDGIDEPVGNVQIAFAPEDSTRPFIVYTKTNSNSVVTPVVRRFSTLPPPPPPPPAVDSVVTTPKQMERLNRSVVAVRTSSSQVYIGWRLLGTDSSNVGFNVYRDGTLITPSPVTNSTNFIDLTAVNGKYSVKPVINGVEQANTDTSGAVWAQNYLNIPLQRPAGGVTPTGEAYTYSANDASVGDLDGDGEYEVVLKWDPSNAKDNSQSGYTGNVYLDAYKLNGTRLWRIDLGRNIRAGAHYTQFIVYDLDGDGKAEVACKTADATIDGLGNVIGNANADYRNSSGYILSGPEFLTVFNGLTGAAMATTNYLPARGTVSSWGDSYGNRVDRFIAAVAYLDGARPSLIMGRGYYTRLVRAAWDWRNGQLTSRWVFDSNTPGNSAHYGQGNHQMTIGDVDGDGKDEVFNGSSAINDNGKSLWANGMGHGDALHMTNIDPDRPGQEIWMPYEDPANNGLVGAALIDAKTGARIFTVQLAAAEDVGRALSANIDPRHKGNEVWASRGGLFTAKGVQLTTSRPSMNFAIWWDADSTRELLDGTTITKWNHLTNSSTGIFSAANCSSNNGTKSTPALTADLFGDWREEVMFRTTDNLNLRIYTATTFAESRFYTLMHDPQYRTAVAWQNSAYNQPPHPSYYLGEGMAPISAPNIYIANDPSLPVVLMDFRAKENNGKVNLYWKTATEINTATFTVERSVDGNTFTPIYTTNAAGNSTSEKSYYAVDLTPLAGYNFYRLKQTDIDGKHVYSVIRRVSIAGAKNHFSILPNPVTNAVKLNFTNAAAHLRLVVTSAEGKVLMIQEGNLQVLNNTLNNKLSTLNTGVYMLQLSDGNEVYNTKMVKQ